MSAATISLLEALIFATIFCGFFGIVLKQNLIMKIFSMDVMSTGVIAYYVLVAAHSGVFTPIANPATAPNQGVEQGLSQGLGQEIVLEPGQVAETVDAAIAVEGPVTGGGGDDCCRLVILGFPIDLRDQGYLPGTPFFAG